MTIKFACRCGRNLAAKPEIAGRRVKCPECGTTLTVPGGQLRAGESRAGASQAKDSIAVTCTCGKTLKAPINMAGRHVRCPSCRITMQVPATGVIPAASASTSAMDEMLEDVGMNVPKTQNYCPECKSDLAPDSVLCVNCGYHLQTGQKIETKLDPELQIDASLPPEIRKAMREVRETRHERVSEENESASAWVLGLVLFAGLAILIAGGFLLSQYGGGAAEAEAEGEIASAGSELLATIAYWAARALMLAGWGWLVSISFKNQFIHGMLVLLFPCLYGLVYTVMHWDECKAPFGLWMTGLGLLMASIFGAFG